MLLIALGLVGSPLRAMASTALTAEPSTPCVRPVTPVTILNTVAARRPLQPGQPVTISLPSAIPADARGVLLQVRATATKPADLMASPVARPAERTTLARPTSGRWVSASGLVTNPGSQLSLVYGGPARATADTTVQVVGFIPPFDCFHPLAPTIAVDTVTGTGVPAAGPLAAGSTTVVTLAPLPAQAGSAAISLRIAARALNVTVDVTDDGATPEVLAHHSVLANDALVMLELLPPSETNRYRLVVSGGPADLGIVVLGSFENSNAYAQATDRLLDTSSGLGTAAGPLPAGARFDLPLPADIANAAAVVVAVSGTPTKQNASLFLWPAGAARPSLATVELGKGRTGYQQVVVPATASRSLAVEVASGATDLTVSAIGWAPIPPPANEPVPGVTHAPTASDLAAAQVDSDGTASFQYGGAEKVDKGDFVALTASPEFPDGYLGVVTDVTPAAPAPAFADGAAAASGEGLTLREVALTDVIPTADFNSGDQAVDSGELATVSEPGPAPSDVPPADTTGSPSPFSTSPLFPSGSVGGGLPAAPRLNCSSSVPVQVMHSLRLAGSANLSASWTPFQPVRSSFTFSGGVSGRITATVAARTTCDLDVLWPQPGYALPPLTFSVGPVPVVVTPNLQLHIHLTGTIEAGFSAVSDIDLGVSTGVNCVNTSCTPSWSPRFSMPTRVDAKASLSAQLTVGARVTFNVYALTGPYVELGAFANLQVSPLQTPWWTVEGGFRLGLGYKLDAFNVHVSFTGSWDIWRATVGSSGTASWPGPQITTTSLPTGTVAAGYSASLAATGGLRPYTWTRLSGALPPGLTLSSSGLISGTPATTGSTTFTVRAIDAAGYRASSDKTLSIGIGTAPPPPPPPPPPVSVSIAKGASAAGLPGCSSSYCRWVDVAVSGFPANTRVTIVCRATYEEVGFYTYSKTTDASGNGYWPSGSGGGCYYGYPGRQLWVTVNGVESNRIAW